MKGKRQTIWLVSMLSLMVVLSAYYLFTEDTGASIPKETAGTIQVDSTNNGTGTADSAVLDNGLVINEVDTQGALSTDAGSQAATTEDTTAEDAGAAAVTDPAADTASSETAAAPDKSSTDSSKEDTAAVTDKTADEQTAASDDKAAADTAADSASASTEGAPAKGDEEILKEVAAQSASASSMFTNYLFEREQQNLKNYNDLIAQINDMSKTPAENAVAQEQLSKLEEKESKISDIETQLQQKYGEAIVKEEAGNSYTVVVLSDKLDVKQAVGIVDLVMKELSVTQDKIRVQYVSEQ
ncbi:MULTISPECIES: SpoIIIAH-like family protein [unclassified Paenibacillus]|uniref:SpoIIIAH-like family protein n=1 Tax=unclassified Paenibacillus TaxID=185978 RepID=UPI002406E388|nr:MULTISPECIES: SpoIIIAH-like family protein [unclassified Paenibacillus]MDF9840487.1 stage III sporulation protein AH [Paenibacillus sp. PastF-2]MDF9847069.1 stage III sporulation protein AH [Paenibacillus sp. PastM-2]MDF9853641.1 stage III sporulation protein AH [Paenibacillus sp. PastF-1]MDH6478873.1 stage III sporulation protein AH [Paenibacillus sp. PastH-2]MDH6506605.1 stage III sporulation protein AH [Paenibacillus sp. PastM-3]